MNRDKYSVNFQKDFERQLLKNERFRAVILSFIFLVLMSIATFNYLFYYDFFFMIFNKTEPFLWVIVIGIFIIIRSVLINFFLSKRLKADKPLIPILRYLNSILEISIPTVVIILFAESTASRISFLTPATFIYFIFIILTILELDKKISSYTGLIAGLQYFFVTWYYNQTFPFSSDMYIFNNQAYFTVIAIILVITGFASGLIANEIKKRVMLSLQSIEERNRVERLFGQQVSAKIVDEIINSADELLCKKRSVCVMFLDVRGFTAFCEGKNPPEIIRYQNILFEFMIDIIDKNNGVINQFMGDGFMATFGVPIEHENDCQNAVNSALEIFQEVRKRSDNKRIPETKIGIGLHFGEVVTGNVGTKSRMQYSITGNTVILAARLEQLNKKFETSVLVSREVWERIEHAKLKSENYGPVNVKGRSEPMEIIKLA